MMSSAPERTSVLGSKISICDQTTAVDAILRRLHAGGGGYICFSNVHTVVMGRNDAGFRDVTNGSFLSVADGKPVYWVGHSRDRRMGHVPGPDFFLHVLSAHPGRRHFLYGSTPETLSALQRKMEARIPGLRFCGSLSPPFGPLNDGELREHYRIIRDSGAEFVWVGLGAPKQERWMMDAQHALAPAMLLGVGAAFDFHAGTVKRAPEFMRRHGLEWFHRLSQEPRRLWRRYLYANTMFICYLFVDHWLRSRSARGAAL